MSDDDEYDDYDDSYEDGDDSDDKYTYGETFPLPSDLSNSIAGLLADCAEADFAVGGKADDLPNCGLEVDGVGAIDLPLSPQQAPHLIAKCHKSPYGNAHLTVFDDKVRTSWQLDPAQWRTRNPDFGAQLSALVSRVSVDLGCDPGNVRATPYKLLVYEEGGHFDWHQDTEKERNMFGTLVLQLPSVFTGGAIAFAHANKTKRFAFDPQEQASATHFVAHYSDCRHSVEKVTSGLRLALVYSLCWTKAVSSVPRAPVEATHSAALARAVRVGMRHSQQLVWLLSHEYSHSALKNGLGCLKGEDRHIAQALLCANEHLPLHRKLELFVGTISRTYNKSGAREATVMVHGAVDEEGSAFSLPPDVMYLNTDLDWGEVVDCSTTRYMGNEGGDEILWYERRGLVIAPRNALFQEEGTWADAEAAIGKAIESGVVRPGEDLQLPPAAAARWGAAKGQGEGEGEGEEGGGEGKEGESEGDESSGDEEILGNHPQEKVGRLALEGAEPFAVAVPDIHTAEWSLSVLHNRGVQNDLDAFRLIFGLLLQSEITSVATAVKLVTQLRCGNFLAVLLAGPLRRTALDKGDHQLIASAVAAAASPVASRAAVDFVRFCLDRNVGADDIAEAWAQDARAMAVVVEDAGKLPLPERVRMAVSLMQHKSQPTEAIRGLLLSGGVAGSAGALGNALELVQQRFPRPSELPAAHPALQVSPAVLDAYVAAWVALLSSRRQGGQAGTLGKAGLDFGVLHEAVAWTERYNAGAGQAARERFVAALESAPASPLLDAASDFVCKEGRGDADLAHVVLEKLIPKALEELEGPHGGDTDPGRLVRALDARMARLPDAAQRQELNAALAGTLQRVASVSALGLVVQALMERGAKVAHLDARAAVAPVADRLVAAMKEDPSCALPAMLAVEAVGNREGQDAFKTELCSALSDRSRKQLGVLLCKAHYEQWPQLEQRWYEALKKEIDQHRMPAKLPGVQSMLQNSFPELLEFADSIAASTKLPAKSRSAASKKAARIERVTGGFLTAYQSGDEEASFVLVDKCCLWQQFDDLKAELASPTHRKETP